MMLGWHKEGDTYTRVWATPDSHEHIIVVAKVVDGWSIVWQRGASYTIHEAACLPTLEACIDHLWSVIFEMTEHRLQLVREEAMRRLKEEAP